MRNEKKKASSLQLLANAFSCWARCS